MSAPRHTLGAAGCCVLLVAASMGHACAQEAGPADAGSTLAERAAWSARNLEWARLDAMLGTLREEKKATPIRDESELMIGGRPAETPVLPGGHMLLPTSVEQEIRRRRLARLRAVVPVERDGEHWCTATLVADPASGWRGLLMAGHCAFDDDDRRVAAVEVNGYSIALDEAWIEPGLVECIEQGGSSKVCPLQSDVRDLMTLPAPPGLDSVTPWPVCESGTSDERQPLTDRVAYGFAVGSDGTRSALRAGTFRPDRFRYDDRWSLTTDAWIVGGDSGGPVVDAGADMAADMDRHGVPPQVCWVISGYLEEDAAFRFDPVGRIVSTRFERVAPFPAAARVASSDAWSVRTGSSTSADGDAGGSGSNTAPELGSKPWLRLHDQWEDDPLPRPPPAPGLSVDGIR